MSGEEKARTHRAGGAQSADDAAAAGGDGPTVASDGGDDDPRASTRHGRGGIRVDDAGPAETEGPPQPGHDAAGGRTSLKDALRGHLGALGDLGRRET